MTDNGALADVRKMLKQSQQRAERAGESRYKHLRAGLVDADGLRALPPPEPLVGGYLFRDSLAWLGGKPGNGKTFVAVDIACCVGTGTLWHGHSVARGSVLYVIVEGARGLARRVDAWVEEHGVPVTGVAFLPVPVNLRADSDALCQLVAERRDALVIVDTQAKASAGLDENSARDMGLLVAALDLLREASHGCVLVVHHEPRNGENLRGSTALEGAADTILRAAKDGMIVTVETTKQKDAEEPGPLRLALRSRGASLALTRDTGADRVTASDGVVLAALQMIGGDVSSTTLKQAAGLAPATFYRSIAALIDRGLIHKVVQGRNTWYRWPTGKVTATSTDVSPVGTPTCSETTGPTGPTGPVDSHEAK